MRGLWILALVALAGCGSTVRGPATIEDVSAAYAQMLNAERAEAGLPPLVPDQALYRIAAGHVQDMQMNGFFGHTSADGRSIVERARGGGYAFCDVAENLAKGQRSFGTVLRHWRGSALHRRNLLHPRVTEFGLAQGPGNVWVLVLGRPGCEDATGATFL